MKKLFIFLSITLVAVVIFCCCNNESKKIDDKRIIGTWESEYFGTYVFNENGTVEVFTKDNTRKFETENGNLKINYGKFGYDYYLYEIVYSATETGETKEMLALWKNGDSKKYYTKK